MELAHEHFARGIEQRLAALAPSSAVENRPALSQALAGAMISLMRWWLHQNQRLSPGQMDAIFHQMVWSGFGDGAR